jgi:heme/copper-type cytochrome/quinol oxidase subunit 3
MAEAAYDVGSLPVGASGHNSVGWWGMLCLIATESCLFAYLLFSYYYIALQRGPAW